MSDDADLLLLLPELDDFNVDDDPELLRAALDFIESCEVSDLSGDDSDAASVAPQSPLPSEPASPPPAGDNDGDAEMAPAPVTETVDDKPKPRRVTRNRRKEEIAELRVLAAELEQQIAGRKRKLHPTTNVTVPHTLPFALGTDLKDDAAAAVSDIDVSVVWEHISKRQQRQRQLAELENAKLRNMITDQLTIARELTREAKRRAVLEGRGEFIDDLFDPTPSSSATYESPLMVRIYPSRPSYSARGNVAMPLSVTDSYVKQEHYQSDALALEGTPIGAAWKSSSSAHHATAAPATDAAECGQAMRVAWQSALRQFLKRRRAALCHERVEDILESAMAPADAQHKKQASLHSTDRGLLYTHRYDDVAGNDDDATREASLSPAWRPRATWQSPSALLSSLLSPQTKTTVSLRLFRLDKPSRRDASDDLDALTSRVGGLSLRSSAQLPCAATGALSNWHRTSLQASSCF